LAPMVSGALMNARLLFSTALEAVSRNNFDRNSMRPVV